MRKNISSIRTKQMLADVLSELLSEKNINKISIRDITERCNINRQTFYYHFHDIYELTEWMFKQKADNILGYEIDIDNWDEGFLNAAKYIKDNKKIIIGVINSVGYTSVLNYITEYIRPFIKNLVLKQTADKRIDEEFIDFLSDYCTLSFSGLLIEWIIADHDTIVSPEKLLNYTKLASNGQINLALNNYLNNHN